MAHLPYQYRWFYLPRPISRETLRDLVESLAQFKSGLETTSREIRGEAVAHGNVTRLKGPDSWKVIEPYALDELERVQFEILLTKSENTSCEIHVEFRKDSIFLSVSDIGTGWGKGVFDDMRELLSRHGISASRLSSLVTRSYQVIESLASILLVLAILLYISWREDGSLTFLVASIGLFVSGAIPAIVRTHRILVPQKQTPVISNTSTRGAHVRLSEVAALVGIAQGVLAIAKTLLDWLWK